MALFIRQDETRTQLQERLATELRERAKTKSLSGNDSDTDPDNSAYLKNTKQTTGLAWAWILITVAIVAIAVWFITSY